MTVRAFIILLVVTVIAIWIGDRIASDFAAPGLERSASVLLIAAAIVLPVGWLLERIGWISGRLEFGRRPAKAENEQRDGGAA